MPQGLRGKVREWRNRHRPPPLIPVLLESCCEARAHLLGSTRFRCPRKGFGIAFRERREQIPCKLGLMFLTCLRGEPLECWSNKGKRVCTSG
jgi:hypothetical protein